MTADVVGLRENLSHEIWVKEIWEHALLALGLVVLVSLVGSWSFKLAFRPVRDIVHTTRRITADDLSLRVDALGDSDEIGELAGTINGMIARLEQSFTQIKRFSGDAAHELSTPLTIMRSEIEVALKKERSGEEYRQTLHYLMQETDCLIKILDNLLFLAGSDAGNIHKGDNTVLLDDVLLEVYEKISPLGAEKNLKFEMQELDETVVLGEPALLNRMLSNLLENAVKFSRSDGEISISLVNRENSFSLTIRDNGIGIPQSDLPHVFERFYRVDKSRSKLTGGSGLGLAIAKQIADFHDFRIEISSEEQKFTQVEVVGPSAGVKK